MRWLIFRTLILSYQSSLNYQNFKSSLAPHLLSFILWQTYVMIRSSVQLHWRMQEFLSSSDFWRRHGPSSSTSLSVAQLKNSEHITPKHRLTLMLSAKFFTQQQQPWQSSNNYESAPATMTQHKQPLLSNNNHNSARTIITQLQQPQLSSDSYDLAPTTITQDQQPRLNTNNHDSVTTNTTQHQQPQLSSDSHYSAPTTITQDPQPQLSSNHESAPTTMMQQQHPSLSTNYEWNQWWNQCQTWLSDQWSPLIWLNDDICLVLRCVVG